MIVKGGMFRNLEWLSRDCVRNLCTFDYKFFTGLKDNVTWENMVQNRWLKHLQLAKYSVFLPDSFSFPFAPSISVSFALLYCDYNVIISFLSTRVLIGWLFFLAWKTLVERNRDQKQRTGKPPFESERHTKAFRVRIGSAKVLQTFPGFTSFFAAVVFCIIKIREMWIHLLELYVVISHLVRLINILSLD